MLPGNHDYYEGEDDKLWGRFLELSGENVIVVRENKEIEFGEICFYPCICHDRYSQENALGWLMSGEDCRKSASYGESKNEDRKKPYGEEKNDRKDIQKKQEREQIKIGIAHGALEGLSYDKERKYYYMTREELERCQMDLWLLGHTHMPNPDREEMLGERILNVGTHQQTDIADNARGAIFLIELPIEELEELREKKEREKFFKKIHVRKIMTGVICFEKRGISLVHGESLAERIEKVIRDMDSQNTTLRLTVSGTVLEEEYERRGEIYREYETRFLKFEVQDLNLQPEITREKILRETLEGSVENELLMKYLDEPEILNLAFELVRECKN